MSAPPTNKSLAIPTPPATCNAPLDALVVSVVPVNTTLPVLIVPYVPVILPDVSVASL